MATLIIGADICPIEGNRPYFRAGDAESLFHDLLGEIRGADLSVINLECPLIERPTPIRKTGPVFGEPSDCVRGISAAGIDVVNLANNHCLDHGPEGLANTIAVCGRAGLLTVGAGENRAAARRILVREAGGVRVGLWAAAEHEFSISTVDSWGANPLDLIDFVRNVRSGRGLVDVLVVLVHGSHEFYAPTPRIQATCRFMIEMGADVVVVQHPHCLGGVEEYQGGHIVYGQGALVMDEAVYRGRGGFHDGFLVKLSLARGGRPALELIPFTQSQPVPGARRMSRQREESFRAELAERSRAILDGAFVEDEWRKFCLQRQHSYMSSLLGHNRVLRRLNARGWVERFFYGSDRLRGVQNIVACETHREAVQTIFAVRGAGVGGVGDGEGRIAEAGSEGKGERSR